MIRMSWTQVASIEETLTLWAAPLREIKKRIRPLFTQERVATKAGLFLEGLLGDEQRKTGWMRAEVAGDPGPWRQQAILGRGDWDADALRDIVRDYVIEHLADDDAVLVIDETGFLKQGKASCGVARQYTGSAGKTTNCQIGVFAAYVSRHGHALIDRALYLPKEWTDDPDRLEAAYVPADVGFATKPKLATRMIARAIAGSVPFKWVAGDTVYGVGDIEQQLRWAGKGYVLGVNSSHVFRSWGQRAPVAGTAADIAQTRRSSDWKRLSAGAEKGGRGNRNLGANSTKISKAASNAIILTSVNVSLAVNPPRSAPHEAGGQDRLQLVSVVPASEVLETVVVRLAGFDCGGTGQATDGASNAIDIAIAITASSLNPP